MKKNNRKKTALFSSEKEILEYKKKNTGQVYTPSFIVKNILDTVGYNKKNILKKHIIDNSCGDGAFLVEIVKRYINQYNKKNSKINNLKNELEKYIHGIEIQEDEYQKCIFNLDNLVKKYNFKKKVKWDIKLADTLLIKKYDGKMDFVVGNPPYVRVHNLKEKYQNVKKFSFAQNGMTDLYIVFFEIGFQMLNKTGKMCLISPNSYLNSKAGNKLREYIKTKKNLKEIIDLEHFQPFSKITTYTVISLFENSKKFNSVKYYIYDNKILNKKYITSIKYKNLFINQKIFLSSNKELVELSKIISFDSVNKKIQVKNGFATLADSIFIGDFIFKKFIIRIIKASTGKEYNCFFPYDKNGKPIKIQEIKKHKKVFEFLLLNKTKLENRSIRDKKEWYLFGRSQGINDINKNKITINTMIKNLDSIKLNKASIGVGVFSGLYILTDFSFKKIEKIIKSESFLKYVKSLKKYKNGGYYTFSSSDLAKYLNYKINKK